MAGARPPLWNVPYQRNQYFTGHEDTLRRLHQALSNVDTAVGLTQPQGISGLGGIGKTQLAVEFTYRYGMEYEAVFWLRADSIPALFFSFAQIARLLQLPERQEQDQRMIVEAVLRWLRLHTRWLLVFDNMDDLAQARQFLPSAGPGHIIFTTRAHAAEGFARLEIAQMDAETGALLLLRRAELLPLHTLLSKASRQDRDLACSISRELDGLPLALDQAGAYIKETPSTLARYLELYQQRREDLLKIRGTDRQDYPNSVATTWSLSFEKVAQANSATTDLLTFCAFLAPDPIPETIFTHGAPHLGHLLKVGAANKYQFNLVCRDALRFSLIARQADDKTLTMHRLVQTVLRENTPVEKQEGWRLLPAIFSKHKTIVTRQEWKQRAVLAINAAGPNVRDVEAWPDCELWVPHVLVCADWIEQEHFYDNKSANVLNKAGFYLEDRNRYTEAEPLYQHYIVICNEQYGSRHLYTAQGFHNLGGLYYRQGKYTEAERLLRQALAIREELSGARHPDTAMSLNNLGLLYHDWGKYAQAEQCLKRALTIREQLSSADSGTATTLNNLALLYQTQGKYQEAEALLQHALALFEAQLGPTHPEMINSLNNLAANYQIQGKYEEAIPLLTRALSICEQRVGATHVLTATSLLTLAAVYDAQGKYEKAESLTARALKIREERLGMNHLLTALSLNNLGAIYMTQRKYKEAETALKRALAIREQQLEPSHPDIAQTLNNLAVLYMNQRRYDEAESLLKRALVIHEKQLGHNHPDTAHTRNNLEVLYHHRKTDRAQSQAAPSPTSTSEPESSGQQQDGAETTASLNAQAERCEQQGNYEEAARLYRRVLTMRQQQLGNMHPDTAHSLRSLATVYMALAKYKEAEPALKRAMLVGEHVFGHHHPFTEAARKDYAALLRKMGRT
jgi:tetratricopeptide (TPR) repeat protein